MKTIITLLCIMFSFSLHADEIYQESAVELCQQIKQKSYSTKCLKQIKTVKFNETALAYCGKTGSWNKIKSCLDLIKNNNYQSESLALCHSAKYFNNEAKSCMKEIANKAYVSKIELGLCQQQKTFKKQVKCLASASSKPFADIEEVTQQDTSLALTELQGNVSKAYELLRNNKAADATILLHDLVKSFEK